MGTLAGRSGPASESAHEDADCVTAAFFLRGVNVAGAELNRKCGYAAVVVLSVVLAALTVWLCKRKSSDGGAAA